MPIMVDSRAKLIAEAVDKIIAQDSADRKKEKIIAKGIAQGAVILEPKIKRKVGFSLPDEA